MFLSNGRLHRLWVQVMTDTAAGAPLMIISDLLNTFGITIVVRGSCSESSRSSQVEAQRYREPKERGMLQYALALVAFALVRRALLGECQGTEACAAADVSADQSGAHQGTHTVERACCSAPLLLVLLGAQRFSE